MANVGLYRSNRSNMIAGVMGGIAERFGWNANLLRIVFITISLLSASFPGILVYLILWLVMPNKKTKLSILHRLDQVIAIRCVPLIQIIATHKRASFVSKKFLFMLRPLPPKCRSFFLPTTLT